MYDVHTVPGRIVRVSQPWAGPIVRGKIHANTEFGAKPTAAVRQTPIQTIGFSKRNKLLFVALSPGFLPLRDQCAHWSWQSPYLEGKRTEKFLKEWESPRFLVVIVSWFLSTGGLPRQCAHWLAMTVSFRQTPICRFAELSRYALFSIIPETGKYFNSNLHPSFREKISTIEFSLSYL